MGLLYCSLIVSENKYPVLLYLLELCLLCAVQDELSLVMGCEALDTWYSILLPLFCQVYLCSPSCCDGMPNTFEIRVFKVPLQRQSSWSYERKKILCIPANLILPLTY